MKFIADVMLGRLAKRLRLLGFDVLYDRTFDDNQLIRLSLSQDRIILTRDSALAQRPLAARHLLINSQQLDEQVRQVFSDLPLDAESPAPTRCSQCNGLLDKVPRAG